MTVYRCPTCGITINYDPPPERTPLCLGGINLAPIGTGHAPTAMNEVGA